MRGLDADERSLIGAILGGAPPQRATATEEAAFDRLLARGLLTFRIVPLAMGGRRIRARVGDVTPMGAMIYRLSTGDPP